MNHALTALLAAYHLSVVLAVHSVYQGGTQCSKENQHAHFAQQVGGTVLSVWRIAAIVPVAGTVQMLELLDVKSAQLGITVRRVVHLASDVLLVSIGMKMITIALIAQQESSAQYMVIYLFAFSVRRAGGALLLACRSLRAVKHACLASIGKIRVAPAI